MIVGIPTEIKPDEYRVALLPVGAELLRRDGHRVLVQRGAGVGSGFSDDDYKAAGAEILPDAGSVFGEADLIVKVKEPQREEIARFRKGQLLFCYLHLAADRDLTEDLMATGVSAVGYETLQDSTGALPLLKPMSEVAGKMSIQEGAKYLEKPMMGRGILLGGVAGVEPANVLVLGAGIVGANAARVAAGLGSRVVLMDVNLDRLRYLEEVMPANVTTVISDPYSVRHHCRHADLVVGAVLIPGSRAPKLLDRSHLKEMKPGAVIVDVAVDQGGCTETTRPTTHGDPTYVVDHIVHYCVTNIPGAVGRTSSLALCGATLPYLRELAVLGLEKFAALDKYHRAGVNIYAGALVLDAVSRVFPDLPARADIA